MSSAEAEYAAASYACREVVFVRNVLVDLGFPLSHPTVLCVDNKAAIEIAHNLGVTSRNKHFVDAIHYFRHLVVIASLSLLTCSPSPSAQMALPNA